MQFEDLWTRLPTAGQFQAQVCQSPARTTHNCFPTPHNCFLTRLRTHGRVCRSSDPHAPALVVVGSSCCSCRRRCRARTGSWITSASGASRSWRPGCPSRTCGCSSVRDRSVRHDRLLLLPCLLTRCLHGEWMMQGRSWFLAEMSVHLGDTTLHTLIKAEVGRRHASTSHASSTWLSLTYVVDGRHALRVRMRAWWGRWSANSSWTRS